MTFADPDVLDASSFISDICISGKDPIVRVVDWVFDCLANSDLIIPYGD